MDEGDLYGHRNPQVDDIVDQEDAEKTETDYGMVTGVEVMLQGDGGNVQMAKVENNLKDEDRKSIGKYHNNPLHNTYFYEVKYHNGELEHF